ncbi:hypothetical protein M0805_000383 [Coniferiporia weirii]|nr:hypothetical protein M0805_000383 [Coniferiporia weirii]
MPRTFYQLEPLVLEELVKKYTAGLPSFTPSDFSTFPYSKGAPEQRKEVVVLLSGSTGTFGSNILAELTTSTFVKYVYAVSRPSATGVTVYERHAQAYKREGLDEALLQSPKVRLLDGDFSIKGFGMDPGMFTRLESSVTHIIHNGWKVDFSAPVQDFEANIQSVRNLIDFALCSRALGGRPAKLIFISSLGVFHYSDPPNPDELWPEEHLDTPYSAIGQGYAEAKWVSENVLAQAAIYTALRPTVIRVGQLVGGPNGYWSEKQWFAALIKSSIFLGKLPAAPGVLAWNTTQVAARALLDMLDSEDPYLHLVHPRPVEWNVLMSIFARKLHLPIVHLDEWMDDLERSNDLACHEASQTSVVPSREIMRRALRKNPALRLLVLFRKGRDGTQVHADGRPVRQAILSKGVRSDKAIKASKTLRDHDLPQIGEEDVERWMENWRKVEFLETGHDSVKSLL